MCHTGRGDHGDHPGDCRTQSPAIEIVPLASDDGGTDRVELLLTSRGCHDEPCRIVLNLIRVGRAEFELSLRDGLVARFGAHRT